MSRDAIDWSKAGTRLRHTPTTPAMGGRNPDWNWVQKRWKVAEEYAGEELEPAQVVDLVPCPRDDCPAELAEQCRCARGNPMDHPHTERVFAAGAARIAAEFSASKHEPEPHRADCGNCYGNGCGSCGGKGTVETQAGREAREEWEDGAYDRDRDDRMMEGRP